MVAMQQESALFVIALIIAGGITGLLAIYASIRHERVGAPPFALLMLATTVYTLAYAFELTSTTLEEMLFWIKVEYLGISMIPALWIILVITYVGKNIWLTPLRVAALFFIPVMTLVLNHTNEYHHLYYSAVSVSNYGPFPILAIQAGPWYWVQMIYNSVAFLFASYLLLSAWWQVNTPYRRQISIMLGASAAPWFANIIYLAGYSPYGLDLVAFGMAIAGLLFSLGLFRYGMIEIAPIARDMVFEGMRDGVLVLDSLNRLVDFNPAAKNILIALSSDKIGQPVEEVLESYPHLLKHIFSEPDRHIDLEINEGKKCDHYNFRTWPIFDSRNQPIGKTIVLINITEQVILLKKMRTLATIDKLTNIYNRSHFYELCEKEIDWANRNERALSLIIMDIDHFKTINDKYGHQAGDYTLKAVVEVCRSSLREHDIMGRYGGEEFTVFLPETPPDMAFEVAERLRTKIAKLPLTLKNDMVFVTASFGVVGVERAGDVELDKLLTISDEALYRAKDEGRNRVVLAITN